MTSVYTKNNANRSHFDKNSYIKWDNHARSVFYNFFKLRHGWQVFCNDGKDKSQINFTSTDLLIQSPLGKRVNLEVEVKVKGFELKYLKEGIHFTWRKAESACLNSKSNGSDFIFGMTNDKGNKIILVNGIDIYNAWKIWPEYHGYGKSNSSKNFVMPEHKCFPVCKYTYRDSSKPEHFVSINWNNAYYFELQDGKWRRIK